jgi:hypothetical protein
VKEIRKVLDRFLGTAHFGEDPASIAGLPTDRAAEEETKRERRAAQERLVADLALVQSHSDKYFQLCIAMTAILFLGGCLLVFLNRSNVAALTALFAATGVSLTALAASLPDALVTLPKTRKQRAPSRHAASASCIRCRPPNLGGVHERVRWGPHGHRADQVGCPLGEHGVVNLLYSGER